MAIPIKSSMNTNLNFFFLFQISSSSPKFNATSSVASKWSYKNVKRNTLLTFISKIKEKSTNTFTGKPEKHKNMQFATTVSAILIFERPLTIYIKTWQFDGHYVV